MLLACVASALFLGWCDATPSTHAQLRSQRLPLLTNACGVVAVLAGRAMAKQCLEEHRDELSGGCREEIDSMIERRVRDFRLDSRLKKACERDISNMCAWGGDMATMDTYDSMGE
eukprot:GHRQ01034269.1.p2 GENE.GHRQ01034269.1~~GHRQ01034269.1.p2  ORF type:complete len:115 (-),score=46.11 GHRQ01034269.1:433-777(-)